MSVEAELPLASPRSIRWSRRRASAAEIARRIRKDRLAMVALLVLVGFVLLAIITPWITDRADFNAINTGNYVGGNTSHGVVIEGSGTANTRILGNGIGNSGGLVPSDTRLDGRAGAETPPDIRWCGVSHIPRRV